jgi:hypothetical protein
MRATVLFCLAGVLLQCAAPVKDKLPPPVAAPQTRKSRALDRARPV